MFIQPATKTGATQDFLKKASSTQKKQDQIIRIHAPQALQQSQQDNNARSEWYEFKKIICLSITSHCLLFLIGIGTGYMLWGSKDS